MIALEPAFGAAAVADEHEHQGVFDEDSDDGGERGSGAEAEYSLGRAKLARN
jgi:hypothetical protein